MVCVLHCRAVRSAAAVTSQVRACGQILPSGAVVVPANLLAWLLVCSLGRSVLEACSWSLWLCRFGAKIQEHLSAQYPGTAQRFATKPLHALKAGPAGTYPSEASWCLDAGRISLKNTKACWACQQEHTEQRCEATEGRSAAHRALSACFKAGANTGLKGWCTQQLCPL